MDEITDAAVTDEELDNLTIQAMEAFAAAADMIPRTQAGGTTLYGEYRVTNTNIFQKWEEVSELTPHTFIPLTKLGLSLLSGFRLESESEEDQKKVQGWAKAVRLLSRLQSISYCTARDGTTIVELVKSDNPDIEGFGALEICPMKYMTLLPEGIEPGKHAVSAKNNLIKGEVAVAVLNEQDLKNREEQVMQRDEFALFRIFADTNFMTDIMGRETYGIYGISCLKSVDRTVKNYMDLVEGFSGFMRRYGIGRLHIDVKLAAELRAAGKKAEAKSLLEKTIAAVRRLAPNEDMVTTGADVKNLATGQITGLDVMKSSFETDIHVGLYQAPLTMGKASGTTFASSYTAEEDRWIILETIQQQFIETIQAEIIDPQLKLMDIQEGSVKVAVDKLDIPTPDMRALTDAYTNDAITQEEFRERLGFPKEKPVPQALGQAASESEITEIRIGGIK